MVNERDYVIKAFQEHFEKDKNIVIYGLGKNTQRLLEEFPEHSFVGLMDEIYTGKQIYGKKVMSYQEVLDSAADLILILARQSNINIIYHRIEDFCSDHKIPVFDIQGDELSKKDSRPAQADFSSWITKEQVKKEILDHDVISFDLFDTLVMRKTLYPQDIFSIVEAKVQQRYQKNYDFARERIRAERKLNLETVPDIYAIYEELQDSLQITGTEMDTLMELELETEKSNLVVRKDMEEIYHWAIDIGKKVYLVTDMYLPKKILVELLKNLGIDGYKDLLISCEYGKTKECGLFQELKNIEDGSLIFHIGDNQEADKIAAEREGIAARNIQSAVAMLEITEYKGLIQMCKTPEDRLMLGIFVFKAFQNPFLFSKSKGKIDILSCEEFGYMLMGPIITVFLYWLTLALKNRGSDIILFSSRDGYLIERLYKKMKADENNGNMPECAYFLTSRMASTVAGISDRKDIEYAMAMAFSGTPQEMLEQRFFVSKTEMQPYDGEENLKEYILKHQDVIIKHAAESRMAYRKYTEQFCLKAYSRVYFFDFVSSGTCQLFLEKMLVKKLEGYYFRRFLVEDEDKGKLNIKSLYDGMCIYENNGYLDRSYLYLEQIVTATEPSLKCFDQRGKPVYLSENRTGKQIQEVEQAQKGIEEYFDSFYNNYTYIQHTQLNLKLADEILGLMNPQYSNMKEQFFGNDFMVDEFCNRHFSFF